MQCIATIKPHANHFNMLRNPKLDNTAVLSCCCLAMIGPSLFVGESHKNLPTGLFPCIHCLLTSVGFDSVDSCWYHQKCRNVHITCINQSSVKKPLCHQFKDAEKTEIPHIKWPNTNSTHTHMNITGPVNTSFWRWWAVYWRVVFIAIYRPANKHHSLWLYTDPVFSASLTVGWAWIYFCSVCGKFIIHILFCTDGTSQKGACIFIMIIITLIMIYDDWSALNPHKVNSKPTGLILSAL